MQSKKGKFIVIEGSDGSGKTEQTKLLTQWLQKNNFSFAMFDFPRYQEFYGKLIGARLAGKFGDIVPPEYSALAYALDRLSAKPLLERELLSRDFVVANRYVPSNVAHMSALAKGKKKQQLMDWITQMEYVVNNLPREDVTIFLHMPQKIARLLVEKKNARSYLKGKKKDLHEENDRFMEDSIKQYLTIAKQNKHWAVVNCWKIGKPKSIEEIHNEVLGILKERRIVH